MTWGLVQLPGQDRELSVYATEAYYTGPGGRIRRFAYRLDGFVALHAGPEGGEAITRPVRFQGREAGRQLSDRRPGEPPRRAADATGVALPGYVASDCRKLRGDDVSATVAWTRGDDLSALAGQPVCIRFILDDVDVFSFHLE